MPVIYPKNNDIKSIQKNHIFNYWYPHIKTISYC